MKIFFTMLILSTSLVLMAQDVEFKKKNFSTEEDFNKAVAAIEAGDGFFFDGNFQKALPRFLEAHALNPNNGLLNFKIGACYLKNDDAAKAVPYFEKAKSIDPEIDPKLHFALAQSYQANKQYKEAIDSYQTYLNGLHKTKRPSEEPIVQKQLDICQSELQKKESSQATEKPDSKTEETIKETKLDHSSDAAIIEPTPTENEQTVKPVEKASAPVSKIETSQTTTQTTKPTTQATKLLVNETRAVSTTNSTTGKITYRIQIASMSTQASTLEQKKLYSGTLPLSFEKVGEQYKYYIGDFGSKEEALKAKSVCGIGDAFIVKFVNGKKS